MRLALVRSALDEVAAKVRLTQAIEGKSDKLE